MSRPQLINFLAINVDEHIAIRAMVSHTRSRMYSNVKTPLIKNTSPYQSISMLRGRIFKIKIIALNELNQKSYESKFESDSVGNFYFKIPAKTSRGSLEKLNVYECSEHDGIELLIGSFIPVKLNKSKKLIIADFDKTLCDTRYSTPKDLLDSLSNPLSYFPVVKESLNILKEHINKGHEPFIVSASPHFYENSIRDWFFQQNIYTSNLFLKDYRNVFSLNQGELAPKDLRVHGLYKLNHLINIILMTGIPDELVLIGDAFESDALIYLTFSCFILGGNDPYQIWKELQKIEDFSLTKRQTSRLLNKIYQIQSQLTQNKDKSCDIKIYIRYKDKEKIVKPKYDYVQKYIDLLNYFESK
jgi:hypothetical protein